MKQGSVCCRHVVLSAVMLTWITVDSLASKPSSWENITLFLTNAYSRRLIRIELIPKGAKNDAKQSPEHTDGDCACYSKADDQIYWRVYWVRVCGHCQICSCHYSGICRWNYRLLCIRRCHLTIQECKPKCAKSRYRQKCNIKTLSVIDRFRISYCRRVWRIFERRHQK